MVVVGSVDPAVAFPAIHTQQNDSSVDMLAEAISGRSASRCPTAWAAAARWTPIPRMPTARTSRHRRSCSRTVIDIWTIPIISGMFCRKWVR
ncbi:hypothetical protein [Gordonia sp. NPDC003376]